MATSAANGDSKLPPGCVVLRVKRKRDEDPAEALVVAKQSKLDAGTSVFHFVGTLKEDASDGVILDRLKHYRERAELLKPNPFARLSLEDTRAQIRQAGKVKSSNHRFKVTSQLRCLQSNDDSDTTASGLAEGSTPCNSVLSGERVRMCDAMQDDGQEDEQALGAVTCNDTVMVREKVTHTIQGYVYDLYYSHEPETIDVETATFDWNSLSVHESELVHDIIEDDDEVQDEEDDSNDEDNWRNDYPDEEESPHSADSEEYDYRNWRCM